MPRATEPTIAALVEAAKAWRDPDFPARRTAEDATLRAANRYTAEALTFAVNQQMGVIQPGDLRTWSGTAQVAQPLRIAVIGAGNVPMASLQDYLAVALSGHSFVGHESSRSPHLLPAFAQTVASFGGPKALFVGSREVLEGADAVIATGSAETAEEIARRCGERGITEERRLVRANRYSVAVIDGRESEDERVELAEDLLLHEGHGCRNAALVFAPEGLDADPYFEALAVFRGTFPAHPDTAGSLTLQRAYLKAVGTPHAFGEHLEFLISRGDPEAQRPGHIRWVPYGDLSEAEDWVVEHRGELQVVAARRGLRLARVEERLRCQLGQTQRPALDWWPDGRDTMAFLRQIGAGS